MLERKKQTNKNPFAVVFVGLLEDTELDACVQSSNFIQKSASHSSQLKKKNQTLIFWFPSELDTM